MRVLQMLQSRLNAFSPQPSCVPLFFMAACLFALRVLGRAAFAAPRTIFYCCCGLYMRDDVMRPERVAAMASGVLQSEAVLQCGLVGAHTASPMQTAARYRWHSVRGQRNDVCRSFDARSRVFVVQKRVSYLHF